MRLAAIVAAAPLVPILDPERSYAAAAASDVGAIPMNAELVTLTESSAVFTWYTGVPGYTGDKLKPSPQDTELLIGSTPATLKTVHHSTANTPFHYVEVTGLEPGRTYFWQGRSNGIPALPAATFPGNPVGTSTVSSSNLPNELSQEFAFTTPHPPPGKFLFSIALANDMHVGETVAGLAATEPIVGGLPPGISQLPGKAPYPEIMGKAMVADAKARGADYLFVAGDVSAEAELVNLKQAKGILDHFGTYREDYFVARGNHDRPHEGSDYMVCSKARLNGSYNDCFVDVFDDGSPVTWFKEELRGLRVLGLDTYDAIGNGGNNGSLSPEQWSWVSRELKENLDQPTLVLGHHPVTPESDIVNLEPVKFDLNLKQSSELQDLYAKAPGVFFHQAGHTHRNKKTLSTTATGVTFLEVGATKEYPGGFNMLRIFEGGFAANFYKTRSMAAREWSERTRQEDFGLAPLYTAGTIGDRNFVVKKDLSGLVASTKHTTTVTHHQSSHHADRTAPVSTRKTSTAATNSGATLPATGDSPALAATATVTTATGIALAAARARSRRNDDTPAADSQT